MTLGIVVVLIPVSMLLVLGGALCAGLLAAMWFTVSQRRIRHIHRIHRIQVIVEPDTEPELIEKIG